MSPNTKRSPATVPDMLATSSALPVTSPVAKPSAKCEVELASVTASRTRRDNLVADGDILFPRQIDKAAGEIGIASGQRALDIVARRAIGYSAEQN